MLVSEADLRELVRDEVRKELRHHREDILEAIRAHDRAPPTHEPNPDELLTVEQVSQFLQVIPDTVRTWIQYGALTASRPGKGTGPGRKYRIRRSDMDAFVAASKGRPSSPEMVAASEAGSVDLPHGHSGI